MLFTPLVTKWDCLVLTFFKKKSKKIDDSHKHLNTNTLIANKF